MAAYASAAALRLLRRRTPQQASPMLSSLFPASYSKAATAAGSLSAVRRAPLLPPSLVRHYCRSVTPKRCCNTVPNTRSAVAIKSLLDSVQNLKDSQKSFEDKQRFCNTVSNNKSDNIKSLLDNFKHTKDNQKSLQDRYENMVEHTKNVWKVHNDCKIVLALFKMRSNDLQKLAANIEQHLNKMLDEPINIDASRKKPLDGLKKLAAVIKKKHEVIGRIRAAYYRIAELTDEVNFGYDIVKFSQDLIGKQFQMLEEETENYHNAKRRHEELERLVVNTKKVAKVCAAVGLGGGLLLILAKF